MVQNKGSTSRSDVLSELHGESALNDIKPYVKDGDIFIFRGSWYFSALIRWWTKQKAGHVGIAIWCYERLCIIEASKEGIRLIPVEHYFTKNDVIWWCALESLDGEEVVKYALEQWGKRYATVWQFFIIALRTVRWLRGHFHQTLDTDPERFHCSELVTDSLKAAGFKWDKEPALTTPGDVFTFNCLADGVLLKLV